MRLKTAIWVSAYMRRCHVEGAYAVMRRRGAEEAGAVFVKLDRLDGTGALFWPAAQSLMDADGGERVFERLAGVDDPAAIETRLVKEIRFDPDLWIVEVEDRRGRHFLDIAAA